MGIDKDKTASASTDLRHQAEKLLKAKLPETGILQVDGDALRLLHELQVHQIELEMQNDELRRAKDDLEAAVAKNTELYDFAPVGYLTLDRDGMIKSINFAGAGLLGSERSQLIGQRIGLFVAFTDRPIVTTFLDAVFTGQVKETCEVTLLSDIKLPLVVQVEAVTTASGQDCNFSLTDITKRKLTENELRKSEQQLVDAQRLVHLGSWQWDSITDTVTGSDEFYRIFGYNFDSYNDFLERVHPDDRDLVNKAVQVTLTQQQPYNVYYRIVKPDGTIRHIHARGLAITDESQKVVRMIGTAHDVTERKALEDELSVYRHKLEELNSTLESQIEHALVELRQKDQMLILQDRFVVMGEMINNIAHQWRQPLNILGLTIQQLPYIYDTAEFGKEFLEKKSAFAMEQICHMSDTIEVFRNFFKPDKAKVTFGVIQQIRRTLSLIEANFYDLRIKTTLHSEGDPQVNGYPNEFAQVLLNILTNARDALHENAIDNALISITVISEENTSVVTITDNAGGINDEILGRIFDPFFTTKKPDKGTGIGLFMSKTIIEKHMGGRLTVRNSTDGAEFRIEV